VHAFAGENAVVARGFDAFVLGTSMAAASPAGKPAISAALSMICVNPDALIACSSSPASRPTRNAWKNTSGVW